MEAITTRKTLFLRMGGRSSSSGLAQQDSWRNAEPRFQLQTSGGVYFWSSPNTVYGRDIDEKMYKRLPKKMQDAVIAIDNSKTMDGNHASIYYVTSSGTIDYFDEYGLGDFYSGIRGIPASELGKVSDWQYSGGYRVGDQLRRKRR